MIGLVLLAACGIGNQSPSIETFNGVEPLKSPFGATYYVRDMLPFEPGQHLELEIEVLDPEGNDVEIWWPEAPPGFDFPHDGTTGTWDVPEDYALPSWSFTAVVTDTASEPAASLLSGSYVWPGYVPPDTGVPGGTGSPGE